MYYGEFEVDKYIKENFFSSESDNMIMVEVGAGPPAAYSNSKYFRDNGWRCICIEPNPKFVEQHEKLNNEIYQYACSDEEKFSEFTIITIGDEENNNGLSYSSIDVRYKIIPDFKSSVIEVEVIRLNSLLERLNIDHIDFLSVDTEGWEIDVMKGFDINKYRPKVVMLENYYHYIQYDEYMKSVGYALHSNINYNYIFIPDKEIL